MLYGLGALNQFGQLYDLETVQLTIVQPRRESISTWEISVHDLERWGREVVAPTAKLAATGGGEYKAVTWCQFCKIAPICRARAQQNMELVKHEFKAPAELSDMDIAHVLTQIPLLKAWATDVEAHALGLAVNQGHVFPGFKLVEGRSIRKLHQRTGRRPYLPASWSR